jgi:hypothetical protein
MAHRMKELKPNSYITREECQEMIDAAIDKHNKTATLISAALGSILLFFYAHGLLTVIGKFK